MRARMITALMVSLVMASPLLAACGGDDSSATDTGLGGGTGGGGTSGTTSHTFLSSDCPDEYPIPLTVSTTVEDEKPYIDKVVACTSDEQYGPVFLHNVGNEIWTLDNTSPGYEFLDNTDESYVFDLTFGDNGDVRLSPEDELLVKAPPTQVSWTLSPAYTVAWDTQTEGIEQLQSFAESAAIAALAKRTTPEHAALARCTLAGFQTGQTWAGDPDGFTENFGAALSTGAGATSCAAGWKSTWQTDFQSASTFLEKVQTRFRIFTTFGKHALVVIR